MSVHVTWDSNVTSDANQPSHNTSRDVDRVSDSSSTDSQIFVPTGYILPSWTDRWSQLDKRKATSVVILVFINLINYMDRSVVAGMMNAIKKDFGISSDTYLGFIQTAFVICYMIFAPIFGLLGDRYNRKSLMIFGLIVWSFATLAGSFAHEYWMFVFFRAIVGVGEAAYSTIAPSIISDLYSRYSRSKAVAFFYFAIPVGTGLGYILGSRYVSSGDAAWRWGLRITPALGLVAVILIIFLMTTAERGESEGVRMKASSPTDDLTALRRNRTFIYMTCAFTCVTFITGALMWWGPLYAFYGAKTACGSRAGCENIIQAGLSRNFGFIMTFAGLFGVPLGSALSQAVRRHGGPSLANADPLICAGTLLIALPLFYGALLAADISTNQCYLFTFVAGLLLNFNWSIVGDMVLYIVPPTRRSFASATQILMSHAFGDAMSPVLIGFAADIFRPYIKKQTASQYVASDIEAKTPSQLMLAAYHWPEIGLDNHGDESFPLAFYVVEFRALEYALFIVCFILLLGAIFFLKAADNVVHDRAVAEEYVHDAYLSGTSNGRRRSEVSTGAAADVAALPICDPIDDPQS